LLKVNRKVIVFCALFKLCLSLLSNIFPPVAICGIFRKNDALDKKTEEDAPRFFVFLFKNFSKNQFTPKTV